MSTEVLHQGSCHCGKVKLEVLHSSNLELSGKSSLKKEQMKGLIGQNAIVLSAT